MDKSGQDLLFPDRRGRIGTAQVIFLATMVALDFAFGWVAKPLVQALGIGGFLKLEMIPPVMLLLLTRLTLDRFGILVAYEAVWGLACTVLMPAAVLPGPLKLVPLMLQGLFLDAAFSGLRRLGPLRVPVAAVLGGLAGSASLAAMRVLLGWPWARATQVFFGLQLAGSAAIHLAGAGLALLVWQRVRDHQALAWLRVQP